MGITRRFLLAAAAVSAALSAMALGSLSPAARRLRSLARYPDSAKIVGELYRRARPEEDGAARLMELLLSSLSLDERQAVLQPAPALRALLVARIRDDFAAGDTVSIGGWVLSLTEARFCALWA
jgi:hypothetical protein